MVPVADDFAQGDPYPPHDSSNVSESAIAEQPLLDRYTPFLFGPAPVQVVRFFQVSGKDNCSKETIHIAPGHILLHWDAKPQKSKRRRAKIRSHAKTQRRKDLE
jgi:hypothetical protein